MIDKILKSFQKEEPLAWTAQDIRKDEKKSLQRIFHEFKDGFNFIKKYPRSVTIFGSARFAINSPYCIAAEKLAHRISKELHYAIVTGGGPGIMQAANKGAFDAHGTSIGLSIHLPHEQHSNPYIHNELYFSDFFSRKTILAFAAEAYVFFPGGFGTLDELFGILTLVQTGKIPRVPIFLMGVDYWSKLDAFILEEQLERLHAIEKTDMNLYKITDNMDLVINSIRDNPVQNWWKNTEF